MHICFCVDVNFHQLSQYLELCLLCQMVNFGFNFIRNWQSVCWSGCIFLHSETNEYIFIALHRHLCLILPGFHFRHCNNCFNLLFPNEKLCWVCCHVLLFPFAYLIWREICSDFFGNLKLDYLFSSKFESLHFLTICSWSNRWFANIFLPPSDSSFLSFNSVICKAKVFEFNEVQIIFFTNFALNILCNISSPNPESCLFSHTFFFQDILYFCIFIWVTDQFWVKFYVSCRMCVKVYFLHVCACASLPKISWTCLYESPWVFCSISFVCVCVCVPNIR